MSISNSLCLPSQHPCWPWCSRPYLVNLLPCLTKITKRQEETIQETLAAAMPKIMAALGHFANDGEIKVLIENRSVKKGPASVGCYQSCRSPVTVYEWMYRSKTCTFNFITVYLFVFLGIVEVIGGQSQVQLPHHQTDSSELSSQRVPTLETKQLLLHLAP